MLYIIERNKAIIYLYTLYLKAMFMDDPMYNQNVIYIRCNKCKQSPVNVIVQKEGMSFTCDNCAQLVLFIKPDQFEKVINKLGSILGDQVNDNP